MVLFSCIRQAAVVLAGCAALLAPSLANAGSTKLTLINGWQNGATNGRLDIGTDGTVTVEAETDFGNAQAFTSLEGAFHL